MKRIVLAIAILALIAIPALADNVIAGNGVVVQEILKGAKNIVMTVPTAPNASFISVVAKPGGTAVYASYYDGTGGGVAVFDPRTSAYVSNLPTTCAMPRKMAMDATNGRLIVPCATGAEVFNVADNTKVYEINFTSYGASQGEHAAVKGDGTIVLGATSGHILSYQFTQTVPNAVTNLGMPCRYLVSSLDGTLVFSVLTGQYGILDSSGNVKEGNIVVLDQSLVVTDVVHAGYGTIEFAVMAGGRVYLPSDDGYLYSVDPVTNVQLDSKFLGGLLTGVAYDAGMLYVCDQQTSTVRTLTVAGVPTRDRVGKTLALPANTLPFGIAALPTAPKGRK